jgi:ribosomal protein L24
MTRIEFQNLKVGDMCVIKRGHDQGKKCRVVYIEDEIDGCDTIVVKAVDCEFSQKTHSNRYHRLLNSHELDVIH